jgi:ATP-dependent RNA helicase DeaD
MTMSFDKDLGAEPAAANTTMDAAQHTPGAVTFEDLPEGTRRSLTALGITALKPVQAGVYPLALAGQDVLVQAPTGSGKTLAMVLPILHRLAGTQGGAVQRARAPRALIMCPTRELASQVAKVFDQLGRDHGLTGIIVTGGASEQLQRKKLSSGCDVVTGTPGRIKDLATRGLLDLGAIEVFALDEVDQMLDIGFKDDLDAIISMKSSESQTLFFSATISGLTKKLCQKMLKNPGFFKLDAHEAKPQIEHAYMRVVRSHETQALANLLLFEASAKQRAIVFCETRGECDDITRSLQSVGLRADALHGDIVQARRTETLNAFRDGRIDFLVATNVAARGIDISSMPLVVNFRMPHDSETYVHRVGRTGRAGQSGRAITLVDSQRVGQFRRICKDLKIEPDEVLVPSQGAICERSVAELRRKLLLNETSGQEADSKPTRSDRSVPFETMWQSFRAGLQPEEVEAVFRRLFLSAALPHPGFSLPEVPRGLDGAAGSGKSAAPGRGWGGRDVHPAERRKARAFGGRSDGPRSEAGGGRPGGWSGGPAKQGWAAKKPRGPKPPVGRGAPAAHPHRKSRESGSSWSSR